MANFEDWKKSATGRFLKAKGLTEEQLRQQYASIKRFFGNSKILRPKK
jgi:hypothetical protein